MWSGSWASCAAPAGKVLLLVLSASGTACVELVRQGVRTLILTSGTLAPMASSSAWRCRCKGRSCVPRGGGGRPGSQSPALGCRCCSGFHRGHPLPPSSPFPVCLRTPTSSASTRSGWGSSPASRWSPAELCLRQTVGDLVDQLGMGAVSTAPHGSSPLVLCRFSDECLSSLGKVLSECMGAPPTSLSCLVFWGWWVEGLSRHLGPADPGHGTCRQHLPRVVPGKMWPWSSSLPTRSWRKAWSSGGYVPPPVFSSGTWEWKAQTPRPVGRARCTPYLRSLSVGP